ncbi:MAG: dynamin family protein [Verrucomicrobiota bacterium]
MSEFPPFGERYFATRDRLASVMRGTAALANETATDLNDRLPHAELENGLGKPFLFVVCGETNAGKSSFLNGLFGVELCRVNVLPETDRVLCYRHGIEARDLSISPLLQERHRPIGFLKYFNLVDTPGINASPDGNEPATGRYLPGADLIFFVFSVHNPWSPATWNFISSLPADFLERTVFIIQQADQLETGDIDVILGHVADLSMKRLGRVPTVFAVSAKLALQAKSLAPSSTTLAASGYPALKNFISRSVCHSTSRRQALETWRFQAASALQAIDDRIEEQTRSLNDQTYFLDAVEREIHGMRETFVNRLPGHLATVAGEFEAQAIRVSKILRRFLNPARSFLQVIQGDRTGHEIEEVFVDHLKQAVLEVAGKDGDEVAANCHAHWQQLADRVHSGLGVDLGTAIPIETILADARRRFVDRLGSAATRGIGSLKVRNRLDKDLRRRNIALKSFSVTALLFLIAGSTCGALGLPWLPTVFCVAALGFAIGGITVALITRTMITRNFLRHLLDTCGSFAVTLHHDYEEALRVVFRDYAESLDVLRTRLARGKLDIEIRLRRWQELFLTLKSIEQDL